MQNEFTGIVGRDGEWYSADRPEIPGANRQGKPDTRSLFRARMKTDSRWNRAALSIVAALVLPVRAADAVEPSLAQGSARTDAVLEAVLAYELSQFAEPEGPPTPACLEIVGPSGASDPSETLLRRLQKSADVRAVSDCTIDSDRVTLRDTDESAMLLSAGPITWVAGDEATVRGRYFQTRSSSALPVYRVVRDQYRWVCLGPIIEGIPM